MSSAVRGADRGFTLIETVMALAVMALGLMAGVALLERGTAQSESATSLFVAEDKARGALAGVFDVMTETSINNVDTLMRAHTAVLATDVQSDRFTIPGITMKQCTSPTCAFHTRPNLSRLTDRFYCAFEYCSDALGTPVTRGKVLPGTATTCPFDGSSLSATARLDGVKFFVARDSSDAYTANADGSARWSGVVFLFPCASPDGLAELRRYDVFASDLVAAPPQYSSGFNRFPPLNPNMIDLFDFGTDGTLSGTPDGKVPLTNATSDATNETFTAATYQGDPVILVSKTRGSGIVYPQRSLTLRINLATGETYFNVDHHDSATVYWNATRTFTRMPRAVANKVTEFAVSTMVSDPYDATTNPTGVSEPNVIRIAVGTSDSPRSQDTRWQHHVEAFEIKARNS